MSNPNFVTHAGWHFDGSAWTFTHRSGTVCADGSTLSTRSLRGVDLGTGDVSDASLIMDMVAACPDSRVGVTMASIAAACVMPMPVPTKIMPHLLDDKVDLGGPISCSHLWSFLDGVTGEEQPKRDFAAPSDAEGMSQWWSTYGFDFIMSNLRGFAAWVNPANRDLELSGNLIVDAWTTLCEYTDSDLRTLVTTLSQQHMDVEDFMGDDDGEFED